MKNPINHKIPKIIIQTLFPFILVMCWCKVYSQNPELDSLLNLYNKAKHDTTRIILLNEKIGYMYENINPDSAILFYKMAINLAEKNIKKGDIAKHKGNSQSDNKQYISLKANSLRYIGIVYLNKGAYDKAIEYYLKSLKIFEKLQDKNGIAVCYNGMGIVQSEQKNYVQAIEYFLKTLKINEELNDENGMAKCYNNIGAIFKELGKYTQAIEYQLKALKINEDSGNKLRISGNYINIGLAYYNMGNYVQANEYYLKSLKIYEESYDLNGLVTCYNNICDLNLSLADSVTLTESKRLNYVNKAIEFGIKAIELAKKMKSMPRENTAAESLMKAYKKCGNFKKSIEYAEIFIATKDSMFNEEKTKSLAEMAAKYESEKRELTIQKLEKEKLLQRETIARKEVESKKQRILIFSFLSGFVIILVFSVFLYRLFVQKKKANRIIADKNQSLEIAFAEINQQKEEITSQRDEIEGQRDKLSEQNHILFEQKKEITDSINYAKRIQEAMLPDLSFKFQTPNSKSQDLKSEKLRSSEMFIENSEQSPDEPNQNNNLTIQQFNHLNETSNIKHQTSNIFILFKPKDVVSGDFYWFSQVSDYLIYAVADCTGHGVPGAFMSMLGVSFLNEIVRKKEVTKASDILDYLRESIIEALSQTGESGTQKDGMDMSLVVIKTQAPSPKFQEPSEELLQDSLQRSDMFIEKESDTNPVATTNVHQSSQAPCDKELSSKSQIPSPKSQENDEQLNIRTIELQTPNSKLQTSNFFHVQWAGANNPLWLIRSPKNLTGFQNLSGLEEVKPDKQPVAIYEHMKPFTNHELQLQKGDTIYLASDGYEDQFGGEKYKKFMSKRLKEMLATISEKPMSKQKEILNSTFENWKGKHEQIDDVTILGIKI